jgi:hypothetical protein
MITQAQFDTDLADMLGKQGTLLQAVDNQLANIQPADFTAEDTAVLNAAQALTDETNKLNPPTPAAPLEAAKKHAAHLKK